MLIGEEQLQEKEGQWAYRQKTLDLSGLNDKDFFPCAKQAFQKYVNCCKFSQHVHVGEVTVYCSTRAWMFNLKFDM